MKCLCVPKCVFRFNSFSATPMIRFGDCNWEVESLADCWRLLMMSLSLLMMVFGVCLVLWKTQPRSIEIAHQLWKIFLNRSECQSLLNDDISSHYRNMCTAFFPLRCQHTCMIVCN